ncbi:MAG: 1-acyl-sn-glycerol-3-phosphate acyltransferase, partial [Gemmatimonadaceae bacterium]|nr:1-acyl-sn-glycerol-3-phosphate acyltransferase [Gemmatimonadaceae bacterium]
MSVALAVRGLPRSRCESVWQPGLRPRVRHDRLSRAARHGRDAAARPRLLVQLTRASDVSAAVLRLVVRALARLVLAIVGVRHTTRGAFPDGPALLVANHLGWLDIVVLVARADCAFVAKREVSQWPVIGAVGRRLGVVFVERRPSRDLRRAVSELEARLREGAKVVLFPEGTTTDGRTVLPFKSSL